MALPLDGVRVALAEGRQLEELVGLLAREGATPLRYPLDQPLGRSIEPYACEPHAGRRGDCRKPRTVAGAIKGISPITPVILLTGWGKRMKIEGDVPTHVDSVLSKPPKPSELRKALAKHISCA